MVIADIDIWRAATLLLKRHGKDAAIVAAQRCDECLAAGDVDGQGIWKTIVDARITADRAGRWRGQLIWGRTLNDRVWKDQNPSATLLPGSVYVIGH